MTGCTSKMEYRYFSFTYGFTSFYGKVCFGLAEHMGV